MVELLYIGQTDAQGHLYLGRTDMCNCHLYSDEWGLIKCISIQQPLIQLDIIQLDSIVVSNSYNCNNSSNPKIILESLITQIKLITLITRAT